jgi:HSP20 family molecular chaperone IbpA
MIRRMRLFEDLLDMQAEANRFFDDVYRRLALFEMALNRWAAIEDDRAFEREMTRYLFQGRLPSLPGRQSEVSVSHAGTSRDSRRPALDIVEEPREFVAEISVPGLEPGDLIISVNENRLTLQGKFAQTIELPPGMDGEQVRAQYRGGVLRLSLPKPSQSKTIPIEFE